MADSGLVVMFVITGRPDRQANSGSLRTKVLQTVARAASAYPGVPSTEPAEGLLVADWQQWFPSPGTASQSFLNLDAVRPTGPFGAFWEAV